MDVDTPTHSPPRPDFAARQDSVEDMGGYLKPTFKALASDLPNTSTPKRGVADGEDTPIPAESYQAPALLSQQSPISHAHGAHGLKESNCPSPLSVGGFAPPLGTGEDRPLMSTKSVRV